jgi:hypothetical protein
MQLNIEEINDNIINDDINNNDNKNNNNNIYFNIDIDSFNNIINNSENYIENSDDERVSQIINYRLNYTVKELTKICEYYKIDKLVKSNKYNKEDIIQYIVSFESNYVNKEIVERRQMLWFCINELKNDKYMKKYVIWT